MDHDLTTNANPDRPGQPDAISEADLDAATAVIARIAPIAERRNTLIERISRLEHPIGWASSNNHADLASFNYLDEDGVAHLSYEGYEQRDNEYYTLSRAELLDPYFEETALARIAELEERNRLTEEAEAEKKARSAAKAERAQYERLRAKFEPGSTEATDATQGGL